MIDETGVACKLKLGRVEFNPCDSILGDKVTEIEDTGMAVGKGTACVDGGTTEESAWATEDNKLV